MNFRRIPLSICVLTLVASFLLAGYWSLSLAWADYQFSLQTAESVRRAAEVMPGRAEYWGVLSALLADGQPRESLAALERANSLDPANSQYWIDLGLRAEADGDMTRAEQLLWKAAEVDRMYLPRWTLANFYFRRDDRALFWKWARQAAAMAPRNSTALFSLCWQMTVDGEQIVRNLDLQSHESQILYLSFLLGEQHPEAIAPAAIRAVAQARPADLPLLSAACERMLKERRIDDAIELWNKLHPVATPRPNPIANGDFSHAPTSAGFDWRTVESDGISAVYDGTQPAFRISFSGSQPEECCPLWQYVPVRAGKAYVLHTQSETSGIAGESGLRWRVDSDASDKLIAESSSPDLRFATPPDCRLVRLAFCYRRAIGTRRIEGTVLLRSVSLTAE